MDFPEMMPRSPACPTRNVHSSFEKSGLFLSWNGMGHAAWGKAPNNTIKDVGSRQLWYIYPHLDHLVNSMVIKAVYTKSTPQTVQDKKTIHPRSFSGKKKHLPTMPDQEIPGCQRSEEDQPFCHDRNSGFSDLGGQAMKLQLLQRWAMKKKHLLTSWLIKILGSL